MEEFDSEDSGVQDVGPQINGLLVQILETMSLPLVRIRQKLLEMAILICVILLVFWVALFLYGSFYYSFMPTANFITPGLQCCLSLSCLLQVMTYGQPYRITLELEMPESPANRELGMFLVKMTPYSKAGQIVDISARSAMLHYRSSLLQALGTVVFSPMLLTGASEQKQSVIVELYSEFKDDSYNPTVGAIIEIHSQHIQIYRAHLYIFAHFTGIRYLLYRFPLISALIGVMSNFTFLSLIIVLSFLQFNLGGRRTRGKVRFSKIEHLMFNIQGTGQGGFVFLLRMSVLTKIFHTVFSLLQAVMQQEENNEPDDLNDQSEPQDEGNAPGKVWFIH
uniref:Seipin n=1 Tax=Sinocyclocheilus rhinocerous TaxID=307959 RepID=A0A673KF82_9TELE